MSAIIPDERMDDQKPSSKSNPFPTNYDLLKPARGYRRYEARGQERPRWLRIVNTLIVCTILYFLQDIFNKLFKPPCHPPKFSLSKAEKIMINSPSPEYIRNQSYKYTSQTHIAGKSKFLATYTRDLWDSYGIKSEIEEYEVLLNYPILRRLALFNKGGKVDYEAELREDVIKEDPTSADPDAVPTFHGYSAAGNVTGELVYVNYAHINDFRLLEEKGINVSGKIVIARYGHCFRGIKVKAAQGKYLSTYFAKYLLEYGAIGIILYTDPYEDGHLADAEIYPNGPGRHPSSVQRGSVQFLSTLPGDPSTPGYASKPGVNRSDTTDYIPSIPSLPISYRDAIPFLKSLNGGHFCGSNFTHNWAGSLKGVEYCVQNAEKRPIVNLVNEVEYVYTPIYNVIGRIPGDLPQEVILGNHYDAWVYGAGDPISGSSAFNSIARAFGALLSLGWRPLRTIVLASWDAEEYGLVGSTEWVEDHTEHLRKYALAYLNVDVGSVGGALSLRASPLLTDLLINVTKDVVTNTGETVYEVWNHTSNGKPEVGILGSGSDYTGFLQLAGIASFDMGFGTSDTVYHCTFPSRSWLISDHSNYDSFYWMDNFGDPGWHHHRQTAQLWGLSALRLSMSPVINFNATLYVNKLKEYTQSLKSILLDRLDNDVRPTNDEVNLDVLEDAIEHLGKYAKYLDSTAIDLTRNPTIRYCYFHFFCFTRCRSGEIAKVNEAYLEFERGFIGKGLPGRPVYKHVIFAPGTWEGYAGFTFPSIREAIMEQRWEEARSQVHEIANLLTNMTSKAIV